MKISTKGRYGLRTMVDLAINYDMGFIPLKDIAKRQDLSEKYLEQIMTPLNRSGLVKSVRGAQGGYALKYPAEKITVGMVLRALEGSLSPVDCIDKGDNCTRSEACITIFVWKKLKNAIDDVVDNITLADLVRLGNEMNLEQTDYFI